MADGRSSNSGPKNKYLGLTAETWGVIGAIAAVVAVLLALLPHFGNNDGASGSPNSPAASSPGFSGASAESSGIPGSIPSASTQGFARQWGPGTLLITHNYADLDSVPPNVNSGNGDMFITNSQLVDRNHLVAWTSASIPTARECADLISTQGLTDLKLTRQGEVICAVTDKGNIAVLVVKRFDVDSSDNITDILGQATVWSKSPSTPSPSKWPYKHWGPGTLLITHNYADLDSVPPNVNSGNGDMFITNSQLVDRNHLVAWTSASIPTARECADLISTQGLTDLKLTRQGQVICAVTDKGNIAVLVVKRVDVDSSDNITDTLVQATVWSNDG